MFAPAILGIMGTRRSQPSEKAPRLKRSACRLLAREAKRQRQGQAAEEPQIPSHVKDDWPSRYSNLQHMSETPMAKVVLKSLKMKATNINFMCSEVCSAAVQEGSKRYQTRLLSAISKESRFHSHVAKDLPKVEQLLLPVQIRKKLKYRKFSYRTNLAFLCASGCPAS